MAPGGHVGVRPKNPHPKPRNRKRASENISGDVEGNDEELFLSYGMDLFDCCGGWGSPITSLEPLGSMETLHPP